MRSPADPDDDERQAEAIVDEVMAGSTIPERLRPLVRATLIAELLGTSHGRAALRRHVAPRVDRSGDVPTATALDGPPRRAPRSGGESA